MAQHETISHVYTEKMCHRFQAAEYIFDMSVHEWSTIAHINPENLPSLIVDIEKKSRKYETGSENAIFTQLMTISRLLLKAFQKFATKIDYTVLINFRMTYTGE